MFNNREKRQNGQRTYVSGKVGEITHKIWFPLIFNYVFPICH